MLRIFLAPFLLAVVSAAPDSLQMLDEAAPEQVCAGVRSALSSRLYRVELEDGASAEFWFREDLPLNPDAPGVLGVNFGVLKSGAVLGVVRFASSWQDYKDSEVKAGVYTLRYAAQPADGDHTGVSLYRDFLLLVNADQEQEVDGEYTVQELVEMSRETSPSTHPSVMAMFPLWDEPEQESVVPNELDQATLVVKGEGLTFGLVLDGHGEIEGY